jgi:uncharacterized protein YjbI with pentapeptide repeats
MFKITPCAVEGCRRPAFSLESLCSQHLKEYPERLQRSLQELQAQTTVLNRVFDDMSFLGMDFSRYRFVGCSFRNSKIRQSMFTGSSFHLCFFDHSSFVSCVCLVRTSISVPSGYLRHGLQL